MTPSALFVRFTLGTAAYALPAAQVVEIVPRVALRPLPHAPAAIAGILAYRGDCVPVVDLRQLLHNEACVPAYSTRLLLTRLADGALIGLLAEHLLDTFVSAAGEFRPTGVALPDAPYLDGVRLADGSMVQQLLLEHVLPPEVAAGVRRQVADVRT